ncbi:MAG: hypothetical protein U0892_09600 [Pirellulales bacterium]
MFGKKNSAGSGKPKSKPVKDKNQPNFFAAHAEKVGLGVVALGLGYFVWDGLNTKGFDSNKSPEQLRSNATQLLTTIGSGNPWESLKGEVEKPHNFVADVQKARNRINTDDLRVTPFSETPPKVYHKRSKPDLLAPVKVVGQSVVGLVAVEGAENANDPMEDFEDAPPLKKGTRPPRQRPQNGYGSEGGAGSGSGGGLGPGGIGGDGMTGMASGKRLLLPSYNRGYTSGVTGSGGMMGGGLGGYGGEGGMLGGSGGMAGSAGPGGAPGAVGGNTPGKTGLGGVQRVKPRKTLSKFVHMNVVTALVPHEEMVEEFKAKFQDALGFNAMRDRPIYLSFEVERVDVTDNPDRAIDEKEWKPIAFPNDDAQWKMMKDWMPKQPGKEKTTMDQLPEVIDPNAAEIGLTMPIPPLLLKDYRPLVKHPDIDWRWDAQMQFQQQLPPTNPDEGNNKEQSGPGQRAGSNPGSNMTGSGMGGSGMMGGYGMEGGMTGPGAGMPGAGGYGMEGGMTGPGAGGMGGDGYGMGMGGMSVAPPKYKMIRFYDPLKPEDVRHVFRYRVRVWMADPNYPDDLTFAVPNDRDMEEQEFARVSELRAKEQPEIDRQRRTNPRFRGVRTTLKTPWSDAGAPIFVRNNEDVYLGEFAKTGAEKEPGAKLAATKVDPQRNLILSWIDFKVESKPDPDDKEKVDKSTIAGKIREFRRGSVLSNGAKEFETQFIHPVTTVVKALSGVTFGGSTTVVDLRGNMPLANSDKNDTLTDASEALILMGDGRLEISSDLDDRFFYRMFTFTDDVEAMKENPNGAGPGGGMGPGGSGGPPGVSGT